MNTTIITFDENFTTDIPDVLLENVSGKNSPTLTYPSPACEDWLKSYGETPPRAFPVDPVYQLAYRDQQHQAKALTVPWKSVLPESTWQRELDTFLKPFWAALNKEKQSPRSWFHENYKTYDEVINTSFHCKGEQILYNFCETITGRTTSHNKVLISSKEQRKELLRPTIEEQELYDLVSIDFSALEPTWLLNTSIETYSPPHTLQAQDLGYTYTSGTISKTRRSDPYDLSLDAWQQRHLDTPKGIESRKLVKKLVISTLYGATNETLFNTWNGWTEEHQETLLELFQVKERVEMLHKSIADLHWLYTPFGRWIDLSDRPSDATMFARHTQSCGVDVALQGFVGLLNWQKTKQAENTLPWFLPQVLLHDGIFAKVRKDMFQVLVTEGKELIENTQHGMVFPVKIEKINYEQ